MFRVRSKSSDFLVANNIIVFFLSLNAWRFDVKDHGRYILLCLHCSNMHRYVLRSYNRLSNVLLQSVWAEIVEGLEFCMFSTTLIRSVVLFGRVNTMCVWYLKNMFH